MKKILLSVFLCSSVLFYSIENEVKADYKAYEFEKEPYVQIRLGLLEVLRGFKSGSLKFVNCFDSKKK